MTDRATYDENGVPTYYDDDGCPLCQGIDQDGARYNLMCNDCCDRSGRALGGTPPPEGWATPDCRNRAVWGELADGRWIHPDYEGPQTRPGALRKHAVLSDDGRLI